MGAGSEKYAALPTRLVATTRVLFCFDDFLGVGLCALTFRLTRLFAALQSTAALRGCIVIAPVMAKRLVALHVGVAAHIERRRIVVGRVVIVDVVVVVIRVLHVLVHFTACVHVAISGNLG
jgi:hypothetical protein